MKLTINKERGKRYEDKIMYAKEGLSNLEKWLVNANENEKDFAASTKAFQEIVESLTDIFAMLVKDLGLKTKDDYSNIDTLKDKGLLSLEESKICSEANGLRNVVVHKYNHVDKPLFIENAETLFNGIEGIMKRIKQIIKDEPK